MAKAMFSVLMPPELDTNTCADFVESLDRCPADAVVLVNAADTTFMDSSGVRALVITRERQRKAGGDLFLFEPTTPVRRVLEIVDMLDLIMPEKPE